MLVSLICDTYRCGPVARKTQAPRRGGRRLLGSRDKEPGQETTVGAVPLNQPMFPGNGPHSVMNNRGKEDHLIKSGHRIAQLIIHKVEEVHIIESRILDDQSDRGGGFGSSGE